MFYLFCSLKYFQKIKKRIKEKCEPCCFKDFLSSNRPHLVDRVLQVSVAPLLLVRDRAENIDLKLEFVLCGQQLVAAEYLFRLLEDDLLDVGTSIWLYLKMK